MKTNFSVTVGDDTDFEDLIAFIRIEFEKYFSTVAILTQEEGLENARIQLYPSVSQKFWDFRLDEFLSVITRAKNRLYDFRRTEPLENLPDEYVIKNLGLVVDTDFTFTISSNVKFEEFIAIIKANDSKLAVLTQEEGFENVRIQLYPPKKKKFWDLRLDNFLSIIEQAKASLYNFRKT